VLSKTCTAISMVGECARSRGPAKPGRKVLGPVPADAGVIKKAGAYTGESIVAEEAARIAGVFRD